MTRARPPVPPSFFVVDGAGGGDDDDDGGDSDGVSDWNLRKCAAAGLDNLSGTFGPDLVLPALLPALEVNQKHSCTLFCNPQPHVSSRPCGELFPSFLYEVSTCITRAYLAVVPQFRLAG